MLERIAGATTDLQYIVHQGVTRYRAAYWVGANVLLRLTALRDIEHQVCERGHAVPVFIHDRTIIEDTELTVDLISRGWTLYNYPAHLAYSATPPDRWSFSAAHGQMARSSSCPSCSVTCVAPQVAARGPPKP